MEICEFDSRGEFLAITHENGCDIWNVSENKCSFKYMESNILSNPITSLSFNYSKKRKMRLLAIGQLSGKLTILKIIDGSTYYEKKIGHKGGVTSICFEHKKPLLISTGNDANIALWDITNMKLLDKWSLSNNKLKITQSIMLTQDDLLLATLIKNVIKIWNLENKKLMFSIDGETSPITAMSFTSDNRFLMSCTNRNEVNIWKLGGDRSRISEAYMSVQTPNPPTQIFINTVSPKTYILCALSKTCLTLFHLKNKVIKNMVNSKQLIVMDPDSKLNVKSNDLQNVYMDRPNIIMIAFGNALNLSIRRLNIRGQKGGLLKELELYEQHLGEEFKMEEAGVVNMTSMDILPKGILGGQKANQIFENGVQALLRNAPKIKGKGKLLALDGALQQALKSGDKENIKALILGMDEEVIRNTIESIGSEESISTLSFITSNIDSLGLNKQTSRWISVILEQHSFSLLSKPSLLHQIQNVQPILSEHSEQLKGLLGIKGKLELLKNFEGQMRLHRGQVDMNIIPNSVVNEEDLLDAHSDSDIGDMEIETIPLQLFGKKVEDKEEDMDDIEENISLSEEEEANKGDSYGEESDQEKRDFVHGDEGSDEQEEVISFDQEDDDMDA